MPIADLVKVPDLPTAVATASTSASSTPGAVVTSMYLATSAPKETLQEVLSTKLSRPIGSLQLECRFQLFVNNSRAKFVTYDFGSASGTSIRKKREIIDKQTKIYDSFNEEDSTLKETMTVARTFSEVTKPGKRRDFSNFTSRAVVWNNFAAYDLL